MSEAIGQPGQAALPRPLGIGEILSAWFERVELETVGTMAIFAATNPRTKPPAGSTP